MELTILVCFAIYTVLLFVVMWMTSRRSSGNDAFFRGGRKSPWFVVAYGMIGASLSGVTFMSVPGGVYGGAFTYMPLVFGYVIGYAVIAFLLLPLYYKLNLTSIYTYLEQRFGMASERTGALFFIISRLLGSALRMYLVVFVLYEFVFKEWGLPFWLPAVIFIAIILLYTFRSGIKTVVWTDMLQTTFLLLAAAVTVVAILNKLDMGVGELLSRASDEGYSRMFETDVNHPKFYWKQILSGAFITITMTGLDQDMMQKNLTCKSLRDAQKNVLTSSGLFIIVNILFLTLGAALLFYSSETGFALPVGDNGKVVADKIFPSIAFALSPFTAVVFVLGMVAAGYSSADGTLTALTTTFCYDFLGFGKRKETSERKMLRIRRIVHISFALLYLLVIIAFRPFHTQSLIDTLFDIAGFTYGPLLGMYAFGLFTKRSVRDWCVPVIAVASPIICYILKVNAPVWFGYYFGFEILLLNGLLTFVGLWLASIDYTSILKNIIMKVWNAFATVKNEIMKRFLIIIPVVLLLVSCASYTVYPVKSKPFVHPKGGMLYALPKTKVCVSVTFNKRNYDEAPYAEFAAEMLGLDKTDVNSPYSIESIVIEGVNEADPNLYYFIYPRRLSVNIDSRHLLRSVGVSHDDYEEYESYTERRGRTDLDDASPTAEYNMYDRADTFYVRGDRAGKPSLVTSKKDTRSLRQRATAAAQRLDEIQTKRQQLLYGDYEGDYRPETLKYIVERLAEQERAILDQFVGRTTSETVRFYVDPKTDRASIDSQTVALFAFSPKLGLRTADAIEKGMDTVFCTLHSENTLRNATRFVKRSTTGSRKDDNAGSRKTFKYRQAETVHVSVYAKGFLFETDVRIAQFGPIVDLPKHKFEAIFDKRTGDLIYYKN